MAEFLLKPNEFQKQVDSFKAATDTVTTLKYELEKEGVSLNSIDKYAECVAAMNELIMSFGKFAKLDANSMQQIKAKWMNTDGEIATKTLGEIFMDKITGKS